MKRVARVRGTRTGNAMGEIKIEKPKTQLVNAEQATGHIDPTK
jgi:hypothetical protein